LIRHLLPLRRIAFILPCLIGGLSSASKADAPAPLLHLPACPATNTALWRHLPGPRETVEFAGRTLHIPINLPAYQDDGDAVGSELQFTFRIRSGGQMTFAQNWDAENAHNDPVVEITVTNVISAIDSPTFVDSTQFMYDSVHDKTIWHMPAEEWDSSYNSHMYYIPNADPPLTVVCQDRWPNYEGAFFPWCKSYQRAWSGASLTYYLSETFFPDIPVIDACIYQMLDDVAAGRR
jgi:hypothetical protein